MKLQGQPGAGRFSRLRSTPSEDAPLCPEESHRICTRSHRLIHQPQADPGPLIEGRAGSPNEGVMAVTAVEDFADDGLFMCPGALGLPPPMPRHG